MGFFKPRGKGPGNETSESKYMYVVVSRPLFLTAAVGSEPGSDENEKLREVIK